MRNLRNKVQVRWPVGVRVPSEGAVPLIYNRQEKHRIEYRRKQLMLTSINENR